MGQGLDQWEERVRQLLANPSVGMLPTPDIDQLVFAAVRKFAVDSPRETFADYPGDGTSYLFALPSGWVNRFSSITKVEYPQGQRPPVYLDLFEVQVYPSITAPTSLQLNLTTPGVGVVVRFYFTVLWPLPGTSPATDLIPDPDYEYVARLAASGGAFELAARAAASKKANTPSADIAGIETEEQRWDRIGRQLLTDYQEHVGVKDGPAPASALIDWDAASDFIQTGGRWLLRWPRR